MAAARPAAATAVPPRTGSRALEGRLLRAPALRPRQGPTSGTDLPRTAAGPAPASLLGRLIPPIRLEQRRDAGAHEYTDAPRLHNPHSISLPPSSAISVRCRCYGRRSAFPPPPWMATATGSRRQPRWRQHQPSPCLPLPLSVAPSVVTAFVVREAVVISVAPPTARTHYRTVRRAHCVGWAACDNKAMVATASSVVGVDGGGGPGCIIE